MPVPGSEDDNNYDNFNENTGITILFKIPKFIEIVVFFNMHLSIFIQKLSEGLFYQDSWEIKWEINTIYIVTNLLSHKSIVSLRTEAVT